MATITAAAGGGNWSATGTWVGGVVPTATDDVRLDSTSGNVTIDGGSSTKNLCRDLDCTGYTGTLTHNANGYCRVHGNLTFVSGMTYTRLNVGNSTFEFAGTGTHTIDFASKTMARLNFVGTGTFNMAAAVSGGPFNVTGACIINWAGNWTINGQSTWSAGTLNCGGYNISAGSSQINWSGATVNNLNDVTPGNVPITFSGGTVTITGNVTCNRFLAGGSTTRTLNMGNGTWTMTGNAGGVSWDTGNPTGTNMTINAQGSTIYCTDVNAGNKTFRGGGFTYNDVRFKGASGSGQNIIEGSNTFNEIIVEPNSNVRFTASTTQTATTIAWTGSASNLAVIASTSSSVNATLSVASGVVSCDYINLTRITASGATPFYAGANSTDGGNNTNWNFTAPPAGGFKPQWAQGSNSVIGAAR